MTILTAAAPGRGASLIMLIILCHNHHEHHPWHNHDHPILDNQCLKNTHTRLSFLDYRQSPFMHAAMLISRLLAQKLIEIHVTIARLQSLITKALHLVLKEGTEIT